MSATSDGEMIGIVLICLLVLRNGNGQKIVIKLKEPEQYLKNVVNFVWERIQEYDLSNLPVVNFKMFYNATSYGYDLEGNVEYKDGFVLDMSSMELDDRQTRIYMSSTLARISGKIYVHGLCVFEDFNTDLTVGEALGTVIVKTDKLSFEIEIDQNLTTLEVTSKLLDCSYSDLEWDFHPDDGLTGRLRRHYTSEVGGQGGILQETCASWLPVFQEFLDEALKEYEFPPLEF